jgi:hypothetical protein
MSRNKLIGLNVKMNTNDQFNGKIGRIINTEFNYTEQIELYEIIFSDGYSTSFLAEEFTLYKYKLEKALE